MIVTLTPNPAVDITYRVPALELGASHRVERTDRRAGGKGVNTAGVLARTGRAHACVAAVDETVRAWWDADLVSRQVRPETVPVAGPWRSRSTTAVLTDDGEATLLNEAGEALPPDVWGEIAKRALAAVRTLRAEGPRRGVLAVCGSLAGTDQAAPPAALLELTVDVARGGAPVVVDGSGRWLRAVLSGRPTMVKPNAHEAAATTGLTDPLRAAEALVDGGALAAMISAGSDGLVLVVGGVGTWRARPGTVLRGNPTGAGDAATAAVTAYLEERELTDDPELLLRQVVGWSGAAVLHPLAGDLDPELIPELADAAVVERL